MGASGFEATVLITTKDRKDELRRAAASVLAQSVRTELLIVDDGSSDGTSEMVRLEFPGATLLRNEVPLGIIAARNAAAGAARGRILFTLDDDAIYTAPDIIERTLAAFAHPRVGIAAIPHVTYTGDSRIESHYVPGAAEPDFPVLYAFAGCANAIRLDLFRYLGGYRGSGRQAEESTLSIRALDAGYVVRATHAPPVHHFPSASGRNRSEIVWYGARNNFLFGWTLAPMPDAIVHAAGSAFNSARHAAREGKVFVSVRGALAGLSVAVRGAQPREPVGRATYRLARRLVAAAGRVRISEIERELPAMAELGQWARMSEIEAKLPAMAESGEATTVAGRPEAPVGRGRE